MAEKVASLYAEISGDTSKLDASLKSTRNNITDFGDTLKTAGKAMLLALGGWEIARTSIRLFGDAVKYVLAQSAESETAQVRLAAVVKASGEAAGLSVGALNDMAGALSNLSSIDDEVINGAQAILLTFRNIGREAFGPAMQAALDLGAVMGTDLNSAVLMLGKALNDPAEGLTALRRAGVSFNEEQRKVIQSMVDTGDTAGAQKLILEEMNKEFGGAAQANAYSYAGSLDAVKISSGNLAAALGEGAIPGLTVTNALIKDGLDGLVDYVAMQNLGTRAARGDVIAQKELNQAVMDAQNGVSTITPTWGKYTDALIKNGRIQTDIKREEAGFIPLFPELAAGVKLTGGEFVKLTEAELYAIGGSEALETTIGSLADKLDAAAAAAGHAMKNIMNIGNANPNFMSTLGGDIKNIEWMQAGGADIQSMRDQLMQLGNAGGIPLDALQDSLRDLAVLSGQTMIDMGSKSRDVAKALSEELGVSIKDANNMLKDTSTSLRGIMGRYNVYIDIWKFIHTINVGASMQLGRTNAATGADEMYTFDPKDNFTNSLITTTPGGATGASFIVPAGYNGDNYPIQAKTGEKVDIKPAGQPEVGLEELLAAIRAMPSQIARSVRDTVLLA